MTYNLLRPVTFVFYRLGRTIVRQLYRRKSIQVVVVGAEKVPTRGAVILAANHISDMDSIAIGLTMKRQVTFLAKSDLFDLPGIRGRIAALGLRLIGQIDTDRSGGKATPALKQATIVLQHEDVLGWHFEGTRSPDGLLYEAHTSVVRIAQAERITIVPVALVRPASNMIEVHYGNPIPYSEYRDLKPFELAELLVVRVQAMSGQVRAGKKAKLLTRALGAVAARLSGSQ